MFAFQPLMSVCEPFLLGVSSNANGHIQSLSESSRASWQTGFVMVGIAANGLGWVAPDVEGLVARLRHVVQSPGIWLKASQAARQYYLSNHTPEVCLLAFERLLLDVAGFRAERA
jgi:hypothetical protein